MDLIVNVAFTISKFLVLEGEDFFLPGNSYLYLGRHLKLQDRQISYRTASIVLVLLYFVAAASITRAAARLRLHDRMMPVNAIPVAGPTVVGYTKKNNCPIKMVW